MNMTRDSDSNLVCDVFRAYHDARTNKRNTVNQLAFEIDFEHNLFELASQIQNRTYKVGKSVCFIVNNPVKREIFAADFRDRVVHHLIFNYVNDLFERRLIRDCYSCRKGFGTSDGIQRIQHHMRSVTDNYTLTAYVLKLDIRGYFMSIDRQLLHGKIERILDDPRNRKDKRMETARYLLREVIFHDPTDGCQVKGNKKDWNGLPPSKSLFFSPEGCGLPIGNLTSQMFSNVYLGDFDNWVKRELKMKHYGRYVDDFYFMHPDKDFLVYVKDRVTDYLQSNYGLTVHPNKIYLQNVTHGVTFLGAHIKPYRKYIRSRTLGQIRKKTHYAGNRLAGCNRSEPSMKYLDHCRSFFNSYFGYMTQFKTYSIRKKIWEQSKDMHRYFRCDSKFRKISLKNTMKEHAEDKEFAGLFNEKTIVKSK